MRLGVKMAQKQIIEIAEFPHDDRLWRIDYLGAIKSKLQNNNNLQVEVILRPVSDSTKSDFSQFKQNGRENSEWQQRYQCYVNIGVLPILTIGSLWKNGFRLPENAISKTMLIENLLIDIHQHQFIDSNAKFQYEQGKECKLILQSSFAIDARQPISCLVIPRRDYKRGIIFPIMEIIRFYYACSTNLAHLTFSNPDEISKISYAIDETTKEVLFHYFPQKYTDREVFLLARILSDDIAFQGFEKIKNSIIKLNLNKKSTSLLETNFPFNGQTNLTVRGIKIIDRFLVTKIDLCSAPLPEAAGNRPNDGRKADKDTDIADEAKKVYQREMPKKQNGHLSIQSQEESAAYVPPLHFELDVAQFAGLANKKLRKEDKPFCRYTSPNRVIKQAIEATALGVDVGTSAQSEIAPASIHMLPESSKQYRESLPATFDNTIAVIGYLNQKYPEIQAIVYEPHNSRCQFVPLLKPMTQKQWSYLDSERKHKRHVLIGKIEFKEQVFWLMEIEARNGEHFTTAFIQLNTNNYEDTLAKLLYAMAQNKGVWDKIPPNLNWQIATLKHTHKDIASFAQKIYSKIFK